MDRLIKPANFDLAIHPMRLGPIELADDLAGGVQEIAFDPAQICSSFEAVGHRGTIQEHFVQVAILRYAGFEVRARLKTAALGQDRLKWAGLGVFGQACMPATRMQASDVAVSRAKSSTRCIRHLIAHTFWIIESWIGVTRRRVGSFKND